MTRWLVPFGGLAFVASAVAGTLPLLSAGPGSNASTGTTWNPSDKDNITLSGGNLIATQTTNFVVGRVRANVGATTGKKYWEITLAGTGSAFWRLGIEIGSSSIISGICGSNATAASGMGWIPSLGQIVQGMTIISSVAAVGGIAGDIGGIALDIDSKLIWTRLNNGNWNQNAANNPATGQGGITYTPLSAAGKPCFQVSTTGTGMAVTANFGATTYNGPAPSGFGNW